MSSHVRGLHYVEAQEDAQPQQPQARCKRSSLGKVVLHGVPKTSRGRVLVRVLLVSFVLRHIKASIDYLTGQKAKPEPACRVRA